MDAIETLMTEHRLIEQALDALVARGAPSKDELVRYVAFLREFADARHHGKEEDLLFKAMIDHGFPLEGGPVAMMLHEHGLGRALIATMREKAEQPGPLSADDSKAVADAARGYAALLGAHIQKEDQILYPMAKQAVPAAEMIQLGEACAKFDAARPAGEFERYRAVVEQLAQARA